jgi:uncharacterized membrane protein
MEHAVSALVQYRYTNFIYLKGERTMNDTGTEAKPAVGFLVMAFTDENAGDEVLKELKKAKKQTQFYYEEAAVIRQDAEGKVHYHETGDMRTGRGAGAGALIGGILGLLGGPAGVVAGAGAGAAIGAAAAHGDAGFKDESLETVGVALKPGTSALVSITSSAFLKAVQKQVPEAEIHESVKNLGTEIARNLEQGKNMALGIILAEDALAIKEVAVSDDSAEVFGMVLTDEAVVAGAALVTEDEVDYEVGVATEEGVAVEAGVITEDQAVIMDYVETADAPELEEPEEPTSDETD